MKMEVIGACRYCGKRIIVDVYSDYSEEQINRQATKRCRCSAAKMWTELQVKREKEHGVKKDSKPNRSYKKRKTIYPCVPL